MKRLLILALLMTGISSSKALADTLSLTLSNPVQGSTGGDVLHYSATVTAASSNGGAIFLNGDSFTLAAPFSLDDSPYFNNFPLSLTPGESFTGLLFDIALPANAVVGTYYGSFQILGGSDGGAYDNLASVDFTAAATPEPSSLLLLGTGALGAFACVRRRFISRA